MTKTKKHILIAGLVIYLLSAVGAFGARSFIVDDQTLQQASDKPNASAIAESGLLDINPSEPKDQPCPLNGKLYTQTEKEAWNQHRPLAVMIENSPEARPQSGLSRSDIVFEVVAEYGVTRFMAMYYCGAQADDVVLAPIRSARTPFLQLASAFNYPMYIHVGGANLDGPSDALQQIEDYGWEQANDINQFSVGFPTFVRDYNRLGPDKQLATEHTMVTSTEKLWDVADEREWGNVAPERTLGRETVGGEAWQANFDGWTFQDEAPAPGDVTEINHEFWSGYDQFAVRWEYNPENNTYKRFMAGEPHTDLNNDEQIEAANVVVFQTEETGPINELRHMLYDINSTEYTAYVFRNGEVVQADWVKPTRQSEIKLMVDGEPVEMARGLTWVSVVSLDTEVNYTGSESSE